MAEQTRLPVGSLQDPGFNVPGTTPPRSQESAAPGRDDPPEAIFGVRVPGVY